ncbi:hypothetical protein [Microbulbifer sp. SAOS-129_SWC]|uniref:hypothetical protein n=1 Tax=Microbulbifer sp. SAOS-129_SWC TaxID=3145235 RepID=UPI003216702B
MLKKLIVLTLVLGAVGCAGVQNSPISDTAVPMIEGRQLSGVSREKPSFIATTPGKSMFGVIGVAAMVSAGNKIVKENNIEDPAVRIYNRLAEAMADKYSVVPLDDNSIVAKGDDLKEVTSQVKDARLLLDVQTLGWKFANFPMSFSKYQVGYGVKMRLIDTSTNEVLAEASCGRATPEEDEGAPTYDELMADNAERLKQALQANADYCVNEFKTKTLKL